MIVYDANTLKEVKRIPMKKPSGKYNVWNKTHHSEGRVTEPDGSLTAGRLDLG